jgi:hypothetical protein
MRSLAPALALLVAAACGGASSPAASDMAMPPPPATVLACGGLVDCLNAASGATAGTCLARATDRARVLYTALADCIGLRCAVDGGLMAGACGSFDQCEQCVQSGRSASGRSNGSCSNLPAGSAPVDDPQCGACVDANLTCFGDVP